MLFFYTEYLARPWFVASIAVVFQNLSSIRLSYKAKYYRSRNEGSQHLVSSGSVHRTSRRWKWSWAQVFTSWHCCLQAESLSLKYLEMNLLYQSHLATPKYWFPLCQETKGRNCFPCCLMAVMLLHIFNIPNKRCNLLHQHTWSFIKISFKIASLLFSHMNAAPISGTAVSETKPLYSQCNLMFWSNGPAWTHYLEELAC